MTPTEQDKELDEILDYFLTDIYMNNEHFAANQEALDKTKEEPMQAILDWHNKQVEELLDKLETSMRGKTIVDTAEGWQEFVRKHVNGAIEAERNKLKESK